MKCNECGNIIPDNSSTCPNCGKPVGVNAAAQSPANTVTIQKPANNAAQNPANAAVQSPANKAAQQPAAPKNTGKKIIRADSADAYIFYLQKQFFTKLCAGIIAAVLLIVVSVNAVSFFNRIDLTQFVVLEEHGFDGNGYISYDIDRDLILEKVFDVSDYDDLSDDEYEAYYELLDALRRSVAGSDTAGGLSNGDVVVYRIEDIKDISKSTGLKFKSKDTIEYTVSGLQAPVELKVSDLFDVSFVGFEGSGGIKLTVKENAVVSDIDIGYNNSLYLDGTIPVTVEVKDLDKASLKNNDTVELSLSSSVDNDTLRSEYGYLIDPQVTETFTVSDLTTSEEIDVFSKLNISVAGVDGEAKVIYKWDDSVVDVKNTSDSKPALSVYSDDSEYFSIYNTSSSDRFPLITITKNDKEPASYSGGYDSFSIQASKTSKIAGGDTIEFKIMYNGDEVSNEELADHGYTFKETSFTYEVESGSLDRYLTSSKQLTKDNVSAYGEVVREEAEEYLKDNWSNVVHNSYSFRCYDQTINSVSMESKVFMAKTSNYSNSYTLWYVFVFKVTDSETPKEQTVALTAAVSDPLINSSDSSLSSLNSISFNSYESAEDAVSSFDYYKKNKEYGFTEFSFV